MTTRPDPHASYREHVSSGAEAVEEDEQEAAQLLGWNVNSNARHDVKRRDYIDKLRFAIANEVAARVNAGRPGDDVYSVACDVINIPMVESLIECALAALNSGEQKQSNPDLDHPSSGPPVYGKKEDLVQGTTADASPSNGHPGTESTGGAA